MNNMIGLAASILGIMGAIFACIKFVFNPYFKRREEFKNINIVVEDCYKRWKELNYSARGGAMISHDDFLIVNKYRSKFTKSTQEIKAYLLRNAIQNGLGGNWGNWLEMNKDNKHILLPLFLVLNESAGLRPAWRSAYILEKLFFRDFSAMDIFITKNNLSQIKTAPILNVIKNNKVESELLRLSNNGSKEEREKCKYLIEEFDKFAKGINTFLREQSILR